MERLGTVNFKRVSGIHPLALSNATNDESLSRRHSAFVFAFYHAPNPESELRNRHATLFNRFWPKKGERFRFVGEETAS
jgi:hypothetical protein